MNRVITAALLASVVFATPAAARAPAPAARAAAHSPQAAFAALSKRYIDGIAESSPVNGTTIGDHRFDDKLPDVSAAGRARDLANAKALLAELGRINRRVLPREAQVDAAILDNQLRFDIWQLQVGQSWAWDPQIYNDIAGGALYGLVARDYAPWPQRLKAATARMEKIPASSPRPAASWIRRGCPRSTPRPSPSGTAASSTSPKSCWRRTRASCRRPTSSGSTPRWRRSNGRGRASEMARHRLVPQAKGDFRLGQKLYDEKLAFALNSSLTRPQIKARALAEVTKVRGQMYALSRQVLAGKPSAPRAAGAAERRASSRRRSRPRSR